MHNYWYGCLSPNGQTLGTPPVREPSQDQINRSVRRAFDRAWFLQRIEELMRERADRHVTADEAGRLVYEMLEQEESSRG